MENKYEGMWCIILLLYFFSHLLLGNIYFEYDGVPSAVKLGIPGCSYIHPT